MDWTVLDWSTRIAFWGSIVCNLYFVVHNVRESIRLNRARVAHEVETRFLSDIRVAHELAMKQLFEINEIHRRLCHLERKWFEAAAVGKREVSEFYHDEISKITNELNGALDKVQRPSI